MAAAIGEIDAAAGESALRDGIASARSAIAAELGAHTPAAALSAAWSQVLCHSVSAAVRVVGEPHHDMWRWFVSGSVARGEAAPGSDVETMVVRDDREDPGSEAALMARAAEVHALLERCDVRGDANGVLASRNRFFRRRGDWLRGIDGWSADPRADRGVVMIGLLADSAGVPGGTDVPADALRRATVRAVADSYPARQAMLQDATALRAGFPSRLRVLATHADSVDLKLAAVDPVVKIARWAALSAGSDALSTLDRLDDAAAGAVLSPEAASSLRDCFQWLQRFRWRYRAGPWLRGERVDDAISLSATAPYERAVLRTIAREVAGISRQLAFLASTSSFR